MKRITMVIAGLGGRGQYVLGAFLQHADVQVGRFCARTLTPRNLLVLAERRTHADAANIQPAVTPSGEAANAQP